MSSVKVMDMLAGLRRSSKCSFHHLTVSSVHLSSSPSRSSTTWEGFFFPFLSYGMVCQNTLEANRKSFSIVSPNSSGTWVLASITTNVAALLATRHLSAASGDPWDNQVLKRPPYSAWQLPSPVGPPVMATTGTNVPNPPSLFVWAYLVCPAVGEGPDKEWFKCPRDDKSIQPSYFILEPGLSERHVDNNSISPLACMLRKDDGQIKLYMNKNKHDEWILIDNICNFLKSSHILNLKHLELTCILSLKSALWLHNTNTFEQVLWKNSYWPFSREGCIAL